MAEPTARPIAKPGHIQVATKSLTEGEREGLIEKGTFDPAAEFQDIQLPDKASEKSLKDPKKDERVEAIKMLGSVVEDPTPDSSKAEEVSKDTYEEIGRLNARIEELESELGRHPDNCPRCSWPSTKTIEVTPSKTDMQDFLRCVLAGTTWSKEYSFFGNSVRVKFRTRTELEDNALFLSVRSMAGSVQVQDETSFIYAINRLQFLSSVESITTFPHDDSDEPSVLAIPRLHDRVKARPEDKIRADAVLMEMFADVPGAVLKSFKPAYNEFQALVELMTGRCQDPDFWRGIADSH